MSLTASVVRELIVAGLSGEALIAACERIEAAAPAARTARQERNARYYQARKEERLNKTSERLKTSETLSNKEKSPTPPKEINSPPTQEPSVPSLGARARDPKRGHRLPDDWRPNDNGRSFAVSELGNSGAKGEFEKFRDHFLARAGPNGVKLDWDATWRNWVRKAAEDGKRNQKNQRGNLSDFAATLAALSQERFDARDGGGDDLRGSRPNGSAESRPQITLRSIDGGAKAVNE